MNEKIKAHLTAFCQKYKWEATDEVFSEILTEATPIFKEIGAAHRWYDEEFRVVSIDGMLIGFDWYHVTGDNSIYDMDLTLDFKSVTEVEKWTKTVIFYKPIV